VRKEIGSVAFLTKDLFRQNKQKESKDLLIAFVSLHGSTCFKSLLLFFLS
jgi:hypothetical protein